jgi:hypothetical protein
MAGRRLYKLNDGAYYTAMGVSEATGINIKTIRDRLNTTMNVKEVFASVRDRKKVTSLTSYKLDDGSVWTLAEIIKHTGITRSAAWARVHSSRDPEKILKGRWMPKVDTELAKRRANTMLNDPDGFWKLFNSVKLST